MHEELDVSGGKSLDARPALRAAVEAIEARQADVLAVAYLDRLTRDPRVRDEVVDRVEAAGGEVWTVDMGRQTNGTAAEQLTGTMASAVHRYVRRVAAERSREAQVRAVSRGVIPFPNVPPGYRRGDDGRLEPDPETAPIVAEAFRIGGAGVTLTVGAGDWERLTLDERRSLIRATCERVTIGPGRGRERISVHLFGE